ADYLRNRGVALIPAGANFVTNACPIAVHREVHLCVTIDVEKQCWHCNDCQQGDTVIGWLMFEQNITAADAMRQLGRGSRNGSTPERKIVATHDYADQAGNLLYQTCRIEPKDFRQRRPDGSGGWIWNLRGVTRVLYRLPEVMKAETVCVTEGEKDADNLR